MVEKDYSDNAVDIYCGHAIEVLKQLPDESVQMCITSPPYWGLRNYSGGSDIVWGGDENCEHEWEGRNIKWHSGTNAGKIQVGDRGTFHNDFSNATNTCSLCGAWQGQLGLEPTPKLYVEHLMMIFQEVKRVLRKDGSFYLNIGDTYTSGKGSCFNPGGGSQSWQSWIDKRVNYPTGRMAPNRMYQGIPPKCMTCIPERLMFAMIDDGWVLRNKNIWHKPNSMPSSVKDRFTTSWEYLYFFVKNSNTILWRNRETSEWRNTRPTKEENYPRGGMYQHIQTLKLSWDKPPASEKDNWLKLQPLWMGFDYYFDLDAVRIPHTTQSLERYQKGKFDDLFGHGPQPQSFNLRVRDVKRGKGGATAQGGELKASQKEIEEYEYPEKHHGSSSHSRAGMENLTKHDLAVGRTGNVSYTDPLHTRDYSPKGKNPGDVVEIHREKEDGRYPKDHLSRPPEPEVDPARAFSAKGKNPGDSIEATSVRHKSWMSTPGHPYTHKATGKPQNPGDYWELTTQPYKGAHFAVFPEKLCERPIKASSRIGDVVLDMFCGSGTAGVVAKRLGRRAILIDCVKDYCAISKERILKVIYQPELGVK